MKLALVTGASSGIGRAIARRLAAEGYELILVSLDDPALREAAEECRTAGVKVEVIARDLSREKEITDVATLAGARPISLLVNCAGFTVHGRFAGTPADAESRLVRLQIDATLALCKAALPGMIARKEGVILNVGSLYSFIPVPDQAVYGAAKAFLLNFTEALAIELEGTGVRALTICPGLVRTAFRKNAGLRDEPGEKGFSAEKIADEAWSAIQAGRRVTVPGLVNRAFIRATRLLPVTWAAPAMKKINDRRGLRPPATLKGDGTS